MVAHPYRGNCRRVAVPRVASGRTAVPGEAPGWRRGDEFGSLRQGLFADAVRRAVHEGCPRGRRGSIGWACAGPVSYTHLRAHETRHDLVCRLLLEKKKKKRQTK